MTPRGVAVLALAVLVAPRSGAGADLAEVKGRGTLRVMGVADDPDDEFLTDQPGRGFDRELLEGFARLHGVKLDLVKAAGLDALVPGLLQGKADVIAGRFTVTEARRKLIEF